MSSAPSRAISVGKRLAGRRSRLAPVVLQEGVDDAAPTDRHICVMGVSGSGKTTIATRLVTTFIYEVERNDPVTLLGSALLLAVVGALAAAIPAWRAARLDPVSALRDE